jgi:hypothetical protein
MNSRERKLLDDQIEAEVLEDLDDPSAWEEPIFVPPSRSTLDKPECDFSKGKGGAVLPPERGKTR